MLYPPTLPAAKTRAERFDAMVLEALEPIEQRWGAELTDLDLAVDDVPEVDETSPDEVVWQAGVLADVGVPLAQLVPAGVDPEGLPSRARIVLYRRPLEARAAAGRTWRTCCTRCWSSRWRSTSTSSRTRWTASRAERPGA